jgi:murein DD-endopeptidase MepM/ murein hydrolase activator NlpD
VTAAPKRARRGLLDATLAVALLYAVYATTPLGAVGETLVNVARGQKDRPSWFATFRGREIAVIDSPSSVAAVANIQQQLAKDVPTDVALAASTHGIDVDVLEAFAAARGSCTDTGCVIDAPERLSAFVSGASGKVAVDVIAKGLAAAEKETGDALSAVEATFVGAVAVQRAVAQATASGFANPHDVEVHAAFFTPTQRRGPLQAALQVLFAHKLRTLAMPVAADVYRVTSPFGPRIHPVTGKDSFHNGTDVGVGTGTPLLAGHTGSVKRASSDSVSGEYVVLQLGLGIESTYCHMSRIDVGVDDRVARSQPIGLSGATGRITGPHLHYILRVQGEPVDAELYGDMQRAH